MGVAVALFKVSFKLHQTVSGVEGEKKEKKGGGRGESDPTALLLPFLLHFSVLHRPRLCLVPGVYF